MLQSLLAERFKLAVHHESKVLPAFALVVGKTGPKMQEGKTGGPNVDGKNTSFTGTGMTMADLADTLASHVDRPVVDKTGLAGFWDLHLEWSPEELDEKAAAHRAHPSSQPCKSSSALSCKPRGSRSTSWSSTMPNASRRKTDGHKR